MLHHTATIALLAAGTLAGCTNSDNADAPVEPDSIALGCMEIDRPGTQPDAPLVLQSCDDPGRLITQRAKEHDTSVDMGFARRLE